MSNPFARASSSCLRRLRSAEAFASLPEVLRVRELRYSVARQGFRVKTVNLFTTLLDQNVYTSENLAEAYRLRWTIETSFGHLKTTMTMDVTRCQTVRGILKELTMFLPSCDEGGW